MPTDTRGAVREAFPEVEWIEDDDLRAATIDAWAASMEETGIDDLRGMPWLPSVQRDLGIPMEAQTLVEHVRNVTEGAVALADMLVERRDPDLSRDLVVAGALIHDVSKCYEFDGPEETPVYDLLGHPYYGIHVAARAGLPVELLHVVLSHTSRTPVRPATLEAEIVSRADWVDAAAIRLTVLDDLRDA